MAWQDTLEQIQNIDFSDTEKIGVWPMPVRAAIWIALFAALIAATWWFFIREKTSTLQVAQQREVELRREFETKAFEAANLADYRAQMIAMDEQFKGLLAQLPTEIELPDLLVDIADKAEESGLTLVSRDFSNERQQEFIVERPMDIVLRGNTYHDLGGFVSGVAGLPRIVTLHDFTIKPAGGSRNDSVPGLEMQIAAKTYRYGTKEAQ